MNKRSKLSDFKQLDQNPNKHTERGQYMLEVGMEQVGYVSPMTASADGVILDGNLRSEVAHEKFGDEAIIVESDGTKPIIHVRTDIESGSEKAKQVAILANRVGEVDLAWDYEVLQQYDADLDQWFHDAELADMAAKTVRDLHHKAMEYAQDAFMCRHRGEDAAELWRLAYEWERRAAELVEIAADHEPTRSILYRSAACLALDAGLPQEAVALAESGLSEHTPAWARGELEEVLKTAKAKLNNG